MGWMLRIYHDAELLEEHELLPPDDATLAVILGRALSRYGSTSLDHASFAKVQRSFAIENPAAGSAVLEFDD